MTQIRTNIDYFHFEQIKFYRPSLKINFVVSFHERFKTYNLCIFQTHDSASTGAHDGAAAVPRVSLIKFFSIFSYKMI